MCSRNRRGCFLWSNGRLHSFFLKQRPVFPRRHSCRWGPGSSEGSLCGNPPTISRESRATRAWRSLIGQLADEGMWVVGAFGELGTGLKLPLISWGDFIVCFSCGQRWILVDFPKSKGTLIFSFLFRKSLIQRGEKAHPICSYLNYFLGKNTGNKILGPCTE